MKYRKQLMSLTAMDNTPSSSPSVSVVRRSSRSTRPKLVYSPAATKLNHTLNKTKSLNKLATATERPPVELKMKSGNLIITCSPMSYQQLKSQIIHHLSNSEEYVIRSREAETDNTGATEHEILKMKRRS